jgi:hypothetical protein
MHGCLLGLPPLLVVLAKLRVLESIGIIPLVGRPELGTYHAHLGELLLVGRKALVEIAHPILLWVERLSEQPMELVVLPGECFLQVSKLAFDHAQIVLDGVARQGQGNGDGAFAVALLSELNDTTNLKHGYA